MVGCVEFIAGVFEGMKRSDPDREGYLQAMKELLGSLDCPEDSDFSKMPLELIIMYNMELVHLAARLAIPESISILLKFGAKPNWPNKIKQLPINIVGKIYDDEQNWNFRFSTDHEEQMISRGLLLQGGCSRSAHLFF
jgi:hypothetical protein